MLNWAYEGLQKNYLKDVIKDFAKGTEEHLATGLNEVVQKYIDLYRNIELLVHEEMNRG